MAYLTETIKADALRLKDSLIKKHFERKHGPELVIMVKVLFKYCQKYEEKD